MHLRRQIRNVIICYPLVVYAIAYVSVCVDPYWYDNSPKGEYIPWLEGWQFAVTIAIIHSIEWLPILGLTILLLWWLDRNHRNR